MQLSTYQNNAVDALLNTDENLQLNAVAGSGKTTMLQIFTKELVKRDANTKILYLAFNNEICQAVTPKLAKFGVEILTFHKLGMAALRSGGLKPRPNEWKYVNKIKKDTTEKDLNFYPLEWRQIARIMELIRLSCLKVEPETVLSIMLQLDYEIAENDVWVAENLFSLTDWIKNWIYWGLGVDYVVDFVDMLVQSIYNKKASFKRYDVVLIDECQDLSPIMHKMIERMMKAGARIISVGDRAQAINAFAGADSNSFDTLLKLTNAKELPLSICYRCPDVAIELAKRYVPEIEGNTKDGTTDIVNDIELPQIIENEAMVICRRNAPLLKLAIRFLVQKKPFVIKGKNFGEYLTYYVNLCEEKNENFELFYDVLDTIIQEKIQKAKLDDKIEMLLDVQKCFEYLLSEHEYNSYNDLRSMLKKLFAQTVSDEIITLSSFHRSKGLEHDNVYIVLDKPLTPPHAGQESNLAYVAITRTKKKLVFVNLKDKD